MIDFESLYREYFPKVYNYIFYRLLDRDRADDLVSDVFLRVYENLDTYDENRGKLSTWIFTIARNALVDELRRAKQTISLDDGRPDLPSDIDVQLGYIQSEERKALYRQLAVLPDRERGILAMKYFGGLTNRKIAEETHMNESTVSSVVWNAMRKLREGLQEYSGGGERA